MTRGLRDPFRTRVRTGAVEPLAAMADRVLHLPDGRIAA